MSNKENKNSKGSSILSDHKKIGTRFVPPLAQLNMKPMRWVDETMPELLWQGLLVDKYGLREGMGLSLSLAETAKEAFVPEGRLPFLGTTSGYGEMTPEQQQETITRLAASKLLTRLQEGLLPLLALYPECPLGFLLHGNMPDVDVNGSLEQIKAAVIRLYDKRSKPATLVIANTIYIGGVTGKIRYTAQVQIPNLEAVFDYPNTEESRMVASGLRASVGMLASMGEDVPSVWPRYFWNRGLELEPCDVDGIYDSL